MIRTLRRRFIAIAMLSLLGTLAVLCAAIGAGTYVAASNRADRAIDLLYENGGDFPAPPSGAPDPAWGFGFQVTQETQFETRYFIVELTAEREVRSVDTEHIAALDRQTVVEYVSSILEDGDSRGYVGHYRFGVFPGGDGGSTIIGMDCFVQIQGAYNMFRITVLVALACAAVVLLLLAFFSRRAIRPFVENLERQRQFVTDASHELKTPLAILSADLGMLEEANPGDRWLESAQAQIVRLNKLTKNLVELARTEESVRREAVTVFSLSDIAQANAEAFQMLAEAGGRTLTAEVAAGVELEGVQDDLFRLLSVLLDNAVKYCDPGGEIRLKLCRRGRTIALTVSNPCADLDPTKLPRYFDRFYRADSSRARSTGGYGIGLSTAKAIVQRHRGRIANSYDGRIITFTVTLPQSQHGRRA